ncbi:tail fiber assembly protein [Pseudomonas putida]|uniref:tail fiber assembly protein n=1 Tax=Pseudomonas putida TaxID=303 RepID=UPI001E400C9D|nr:tail fiber assembly protein [Pseudomonas putida]
MLIKLSPIRSDAPLVVFRFKDQLTVNGVALDFTELQEGASLPPEAVGSSDVLEPIERVNGQLVVTLRLPHAADAPESARFPADIINPSDGPVSLPGLEIGEPQPAVSGVIDWSMMVTSEMKAAKVAAETLARAQAESARLRKIADDAIAPMQDAVELGRADQAKQDLLKAWKNYRLDLVEVPEQAGYPASIDWPAPPA